MKSRVIVTFLFLMFFGIGCVLAESFWEDVTAGLGDREFYAIAGGRDKSGKVYIGTANGVYQRIDAEKKWKQIFISRGEEKGVSHIYVDGADVIYIATKNGLYRSQDSGGNWERFFKGITKQNQTTYVTSDEKNGKTVYLGTMSGLFWTKDEGKSWQKPGGVLGSSSIRSIAIADENIFVLCDNEIYKSDREFKNYEKIFGSDSPKNSEDDNANDVIISEEEETATFLLNDIIVKRGVIYLSTSRGLFTSEDNGATWNWFDANGLSNRWINHTFPFETDSGIFVATKNGAFQYGGAEDGWVKIYAGMDATEVKRFFVADGGNYIWAISNPKVYRMELCGLNAAGEKALDSDGIFLKFASEPTVNEVQKMAIEYAEVYPEKIEKWRKGAKLRAIFPKVTFGLDQSKSDTYEIYTSSTTSYWVNGPADESEGWDLNFTWDLADLVWSESQTSIDVRSKLMVQLRDDIVNEVTRTYFERRRMQIENLTNPSKDLQAELKKDLRLQELTASLDGLTGGRFSTAIRNSE